MRQFAQQPRPQIGVQLAAVLEQAPIPIHGVVFVAHPAQVLQYEDAEIPAAVAKEQQLGQLQTGAAAHRQPTGDRRHPSADAGCGAALRNAGHERWLGRIRLPLQERRRATCSVRRLELRQQVRPGSAGRGGLRPAPPRPAPQGRRGSVRPWRPASRTLRRSRILSSRSKAPLRPVSRANRRWAAALSPSTANMKPRSTGLSRSTCLVRTKRRTRSRLFR